jgi:hypothetical protein
MATAREWVRVRVVAERHVEAIGQVDQAAHRVR